MIHVLEITCDLVRHSLYSHLLGMLIANATHIIILNNTTTLGQVTHYLVTNV